MSNKIVNRTSSNLEVDDITDVADITEIASKTYFALYSLQVQYNLNLGELNAKHEQMLRVYHPDNLQNNSHKIVDRQVSDSYLSAAAILNQAYTTLLEPHTRLKYLQGLLQNLLQNMTNTTNTNEMVNLSADKLLSHIQLREHIEQADTKAELEVLLNDVQCKQSSLALELDKKLQEINFAQTNATQTNVAASAAQNKTAENKAVEHKQGLSLIEEMLFYSKAEQTIKVKLKQKVLDNL